MRTIGHVGKAISDLLQRLVCRHHLPVGILDRNAQRLELLRQPVITLGRLNQVDAQLGQAFAKGGLVNIRQLGCIAQANQRIGCNTGLGLQVKQFIAGVDGFLDHSRQAAHDGAASDRCTKSGHRALEVVEPQRGVLGLALQALHGVAQPANIVLALNVRLNAEHGVHVHRHVSCSGCSVPSSPRLP